MGFDSFQEIISQLSKYDSVAVSERGQNISLTVLRGGGTFGRVSVFCYSQASTETAVQGGDFVMMAEVSGWVSNVGG